MPPPVSDPGREGRFSDGRPGISAHEPGDASRPGPPARTTPPLTAAAPGRRPSPRPVAAHRRARLPPIAAPPTGVSDQAPIARTTAPETGTLRPGGNDRTHPFDPLGQRTASDPRPQPYRPHHPRSRTIFSREHPASPSGQPTPSTPSARATAPSTASLRTADPVDPIPRTTGPINPVPGRPVPSAPSPGRPVPSAWTTGRCPPASGRPCPRRRTEGPLLDGQPLPPGRPAGPVSGTTELTLNGRPLPQEASGPWKCRDPSLVEDECPSWRTNVTYSAPGHTAAPAPSPRRPTRPNTRAGGRPQPTLLRNEPSSGSSDHGPVEVPERPGRSRPTLPLVAGAVLRRPIRMRRRRTQPEHAQLPDLHPRPQLDRQRGHI